MTSTNTLTPQKLQSLQNVEILISTARTKSGFTQKKCAARVGITNKELAAYEHGEKEPPIETLLALCEVLQCDITDLYNRKTKGPISKSRAIDLTGLTFGRLYVIKRSGNDVHNGLTLWECQCSCGNTIIARSDHLREGRTTSCGCARVGVVYPNLQHGSADAVRAGCECLECNKRRTKMKHHGTL